MEQKLIYNQNSEELQIPSIDIPEGFEAKIEGNSITFVKKKDIVCMYNPFCISNKWVVQKIDVSEMPYTADEYKREGMLFKTEEECRQLCEALTQNTKETIKEWNKLKHSENA